MSETRPAQMPSSIGVLAFVEHGGITAGPDGPRSVGMDQGIELIARAEQLGFDAAYVRARHLQSVLASPLIYLAAVAQQVPRIALGTQVIPLRFENAGRLAEDLATCDLLLGGRLRAGLSTGYSAHDTVNVRAFGSVRGSVREHVDRVLTDLLSFVDGEIVALADDHIETACSGDPLRITPQVPGLREHLFYGAADASTAELAGRWGLGLQLSTLHPDDGSGRSFEEMQRATIDAYRDASRAAGHGRGTVSIGRQMIPVTEANELEHDSDLVDRDRAGRATAGREHRGVEIGGREAVFGTVVVDEPQAVIEALTADVAVQAADELVLTLPGDQDHAKVMRILEVFGTEVMPALRD